MEVVYGLLFVLLIVGLIVIVVINNSNAKIVKEHSPLYGRIISTNSKYKFHDVSRKTIKFSPCVKSKRSLDNLDLSQYVLSEVANNINYYKNLFKNLDKNKSNFLLYTNEYKSLEKYVTPEEFNKLNLTKIKYKTFLIYEKKLYNKMLLKEPQFSVSATCHATYTSPSGKNHYWKDLSFTYQDLKNFINKIEDEETRCLAASAIKQKSVEEKKEKERKLRELEKLEKKLAKDKEQLTKDKQEFEQATKGHIYSSQNDSIEKTKDEIIINDYEEPYIKLKKLRQMLDNGQITLETYSDKKRELL